MITHTFINGLWQAEASKPRPDGGTDYYYFKGYGHTPEAATLSLLAIIPKLSHTKPRSPLPWPNYDLSVLYNPYLECWTASTILDMAVMPMANADTPEEATLKLLASLPGDYHYHVYGVDTSSFLFNN